MAVTGPARPGGATTAPPGRWWSHPSSRVGLLTGLTGVAAAGVVVSFAGDRYPASALPGGAWWLAALALLFALTEGFTVYIRVRRGAHAINLSEFPMVLGLLVFHPALVIVARALAGGAGLMLLRRQRGGKLAFNVALLAVQAAVAVQVFHLITPHALGSTPDGLDAREWLATYAAMVAADVTAAVLLTAVIALHDDPGEWRRLPAALRSAWMVAATTTVALVSFSAAVQARWALALVAVVAVVLFLAYRAYVKLGDGNAEVEQLYGFTRALDGPQAVEDLIAVVLERSRDVLRVETAELVLSEDGRLRHIRLTGHATATVCELGGGDDDWLLPALSGTPVLRPATPSPAGAPPVPHGDGMAVPVVTGEDRAVLAVSGSLTDAGTFTEARLRLFQALANHAAAALGRAVLVDRLRREAAEKLHLSLHDSLTGLPNRRSFHQLLEAALADARDGRTGVAVMLVDLDRFKEINDALGHDTGDALLREVGERLQAHLTGRGVVARLGGDEFAVLLPTDGATESAVTAAADLGDLLDRSIRMGPLALTARASIGVAAAPQHGDDAQTLLRQADVAMYAAKDNHSGQRLYDPATDVNSPQRLALIADLRVAVERRDLVVAFQPKVEPCTGRVVGAEALARWHHPVRGFVPPDQFIPLAEHSGLVRPLTLHVLELALRRRAAWARAGHDLHVAVNLSPNSLLDADLPEAVGLLLAQTGNPPHQLTLEITESTILADPAGSLATLERLHALGVKLSIDDFGTGYSSLGRLRALPIHEVKIDRSFVQRSAGDHRDRAVVRSAIQLGHALDLEVVAEGVEDATTYAYLAREGCDTVQGYHLSRPLPPDEFLDWVISHGASLILSASQD
ncbi:MAG TPA: bifunctional diguanylate cyclase/phosphodiesterase [Actinoplanes sp.]|nr:bifunctional diguanylate cyclase/phosphodiesterase [Actinoplanes sp.]